MPVISKIKHAMLVSQLRVRYENLTSAFKGRELNRPSEGCKKGHWATPDRMYATTASIAELSMAVEDFKTILNEIKKLK